MSVLTSSTSSITSDSNQRADVTQLISNIRIIVTPRSECPSWAPPSSPLIRNDAVLDMGLISSMNSLNTADLATEMTSKLNTKYDQDYRSKQDGTFAGLGSSSANQLALVDHKLTQNIMSVMDTKIASWKKQTARVDQTIQQVDIPQGCTMPGLPPMTISNDSYIQQRMSDLAAVVTDAVLKAHGTDETTSTSDQKRTAESVDTFGQFRDGVLGVSEDAFGTLNNLGLVSMGTMGLALLGIVFFIPLMAWILTRNRSKGPPAPVPTQQAAPTGP